MLSQKEFDILLQFIKEKSPTQRNLSAATGFSLGTVNNILKKLQEKGLISNNALTNAGLKKLESYKVDNAIIMAAGMSSRFAPLSYEKPKGLLSVKGEIMIERQIEQLHQAGIKNITIVVGYMKEHFFYLEEKFNVKIVVNNDYYRYNNTSTLMLVLEQLANTYICSSDNYFPKNPFKKYEYCGYYSTLYADGKTDEWCVKSDTHGTIKKITVSGEDTWYMMGHVYFDRDFSKKFVEILKNEYDLESTRYNLWEDVYRKNIDKLKLKAKHYNNNEILEFDSLSDLKKFDKDYLKNTNSKIINNICKVFSCDENLIKNISTLKKGASEIIFKFDIENASYVYRYPNINSSEYTNYLNEADVLNNIQKTCPQHNFIHIDKDEYWMITDYHEIAHFLDYENEHHIEKAFQFIKKLHACHSDLGTEFELWTITKSLLSKLKKSGRLTFEGFAKLNESIEALKSYIDSDSYPKVMCNNNFYDKNIMFDTSGNILLSDWKYAGAGDPYYEIGTFICCSSYDEDEIDKILMVYHDGLMTRNQYAHALGCLSIAAYHWYIWGIYQDSRGITTVTDLYKWFKYANHFCQKALNLYKEQKEN